MLATRRVPAYSSRFDSRPPHWLVCSGSAAGDLHAIGCDMAAYLKEHKSEVIQDFARKDKDTGSAEVQIALLTNRINELTGHLKTHKKDHSSRRGLLMMVGRRNSMLKYLIKTDHSRYLAVIAKLGLRK
jgi:small subunit ribosomal protein S15